MKISLDIENKEEVILWLQNIKRGTGDARPLWHAVTPKIIEFVNMQFDETGDGAAKAGWKSLKPKYKAWKIKKGYPGVIGVMTGKLKIAAGEQAVREYKERELVWGVNNDVATSNRTGTEYAKYFNAKRNIYRNTVLRMNSFLSFDIKQFIGGSHNSFTYIWLRDSLRGMKE